ncbi:glucuronate isomerase [Pelagibacterium sp. 26DY04]|uniref:glucuronate isomerase n=1 Tax=Pelagibacterium sp. 26DY04 TaxID=2967130 RepID=UPI0028169A8D|nr:glucuronate isomerase [Pelagibacterium sp. 26DY04]WMT85490.1 glucuronate isomerase [Pelagibacterium sp. 26DY04]
MSTLLHPDRLFSANATERDIARALYESISDLPLISPHGHTDPRWFAENENFANASELLVVPDHYVFRMLLSQGLRLEVLGIAPHEGTVESDPRAIWRRFAENYHLFAGTPTRLWLDHTFETLFELHEPLSRETADTYFDAINALLAREDYRPRALFDRFGIEVIATTESALDDLRWHDQIKDSGWSGRVVTTYRPDAVIDPDFEGFGVNLDTFGEITDCDTGTWAGYLDAHRKRRAYFKQRGATATDHGHPTAETANLSAGQAQALFDKVRAGKGGPDDHGLFRAQMLTEMAKMSLEDGLVMQIHPGSFRNHSEATFTRFGRDKGFDIPTRTDYVEALRPLLSVAGMDPDFRLIIFTLDESAYSRELAPLAGVYPALRLGPAWWFHDSPEGMRRYRELTTETAGFYNSVGFNDDTRAFPSIPARHDVARRVDSAFLARLVADHRIREDEAFHLIHELSYGLAKKAYRL